jgi:hypothetical protein
MLILIAIAVFVALAVAIMFLYYRNIKASEALFTARRDIARSQARLQAAKKAAQEAEERCRQLMRQINTSMASTGQALNIARHIEVVRQQLEELFELIAYPDTAGRHASAEAGQPAITAHAHHQNGQYPPLPLEPGMTPYGPREVRGEPDPASLAHAHADHTRPLPVTTYSPPASWAGPVPDHRRTG